MAEESSGRLYIDGRLVGGVRDLVIDDGRGRVGDRPFSGCTTISRTATLDPASVDTLREFMRNAPPLPSYFRVHGEPVLAALLLLIERGDDRAAVLASLPLVLAGSWQDKERIARGAAAIDVSATGVAAP